MSSTQRERQQRSLWRLRRTEVPNLTMERFFEMPSKWTFTQPKTRNWVEERLSGNVLNLFGGVTKLTAPEGFVVVHNDINTDIPADLHRDAYDLTKWLDYENYFDTVVLDPPFTAHQAVVSYGIKKAQKITHARDVTAFVLKPHGTVISLGYNSTGMGETRLFTKNALLLVNHGGSHNDLICLSESR